MSTPENPPAFPLYHYSATPPGVNMAGMTLRDYFAAAAFQGLLAHRNLGTIIDCPWLAQTSYVLADEMLAARSTPTPQ